jgi:hypothetical protein
MRPTRLALLMLLAATGCAKRPAAELRDDFERTELGARWLNSGGPYRIADGRLHVAGARNHPLWLREPLPRDLVLELTAESHSPSGDIKFELFGDGESKPQALSYVASGYVFIFGGWHNRRSMIARRDEHGPQVVARSDVRVEPARRYRFRVERQGELLRWFIDGELFLSYRDPQPLYGPDNRYFAFNNWETPVAFDDLVIRELR